MSSYYLTKGRLAPIDRPLITVVMDGVGLSTISEGNAFSLARTPTLDALFKRYGCLSLRAHGSAVGLPSEEDMGNSEVGHNTLGAGRVFEQGASLVQNAIQSGAMWEGETWSWLVEGVKSSGEALHWIGLLSDGNVHSHEAHLHAMLRRAAQEGVERGRIHVLFDGRDVSEISAELYLERLEKVLAEINQSGYDYRIASGGGRMTTTMDRYEADWAMVERGWKVHVLGEGLRFSSALEALQSMRDAQPGIIDQYLPSFVVADHNGPIGPIKDGASVCFFNFRGDRALEISRAFEEGNDFKGFKRTPVQVRYAGMMQYDGDLQLPQKYLVTPPQIDESMSELLASAGIAQFACSETQKFGHVTYFWNGNRSGTFDANLEFYHEIPSDDVPFEQRPWMKAADIVDATLKALEERSFPYARINLANGDMVGHTGDLRATIIALEALDLSLSRLLKGIDRLGGLALITADHGNAEQMFERDKKTGALLLNADGTPKALTSHTLNPVPLSLFDPHQKAPKLMDQQQLIQENLNPGLANLASTTLELLGFNPPDTYERSLLR